MNPTTFRPTAEVRELLTKERQARPGVPVSFIINELLTVGFQAGRRTARRSKRGAVAIGGAK